MRIAWICLALSGCFYFDPINQRPSIEIHSDVGDRLVHHGDPVRLDAVYDDPDGEGVTFNWRISGCGDDGVCDDTFIDSNGDFVEFKVPPSRTDGSPVASIRATLDAVDDLGAKAKPQQLLEFATANAAPDLATRKVARNAYVVNTDIFLYAAYGDIDDGRDKVTLTPADWHVFKPSSQPAYELTPFDVPDGDDTHHTQGMTLRPHGVGDWTVQVIATDPRMASTMQDIPIHVEADKPPCLAQWLPATPPPGQTLPITDPTLFQVPIVDDDLDLYPPQLDDSVLGVTQFAWSLKRNAGPRQVQVGATGNSLDFDPAAFTPGDIVEVRVEIFDRNNNSLASCGDAAAECSITPATPTCLQRETWRVEVR